MSQDSTVPKFIQLIAAHYMHPEHDNYHVSYDLFALDEVGGIWYFSRNEEWVPQSSKRRVK